MENMDVPASYFLLFQWRLSAPYRLAPQAAASQTDPNGDNSN